MLEIISFILSIVIAAIFIGIQSVFYRNNKAKLKIVKNFFQKDKDYENESYAVYGKDEDTQLIEFIAPEGSNLRNLITELNEYIKKNHGTTDFSIIQNKTERRIELLYEDATSKLAFPIYIGLMGTFLGVFMGLLFFSIGLSGSPDGISDGAIRNLINGVLVSMSTSFIGLFLSTKSNHFASEVRKKVDEDKSSFFEYIQNELMPTLGVSMVAALNKLHQTINLFEPTFNRVIERFQTTFDICTQRFGNAFERNVIVVSEAVKAMGENMDKINQNVELNERLIKTMQSEDIRRTLDVFIDASFSYGLIVDRTRKFEEIGDLLEKRILELINTQSIYNKSLEIPLSVANKLNAILARVTDFEKGVNALGKTIEKTQLLGNSEIELVKEQITAIKKKQKIAMQYMEISDGRLEDIFKLQAENIRKLNKKYEESLAGYAERFDNVLEQLGEEMQTRRKEIVNAIEEKFSLEQIQQEFSQLSKLNKIEELLKSIDTKSSRDDVDSVLRKTREEVETIRKTLTGLIAEARKTGETKRTPQAPPERQTSGGGFFGGIFGRGNR